MDAIKCGECPKYDGSMATYTKHYREAHPNCKLPNHHNNPESNTEQVTTDTDEFESARESDNDDLPIDNINNFYSLNIDGEVPESLKQEDAQASDP